MEIQKATVTLRRLQEPICNCQPHEICHHGQCYPNTRKKSKCAPLIIIHSECTSIYCEPGTYCVEGQCLSGGILKTPKNQKKFGFSAIGKTCQDDTCHGGTVCVNGVCVANPCPGRWVSTRNTGYSSNPWFRCPHDQDCRLGECRIMEGLPCIGECKHPFLCVDGRCRRNGTVLTTKCRRLEDYRSRFFWREKFFLKNVEEKRAWPKFCFFVHRRYGREICMQNFGHALLPTNESNGAHLHFIKKMFQNLIKFFEFLRIFQCTLHTNRC